MRTTFIKKITEFAQTDPNVYLVAGDVGFSVIEEFAQKFPTRYFNAGVAEQNMIGVAAGLAMAGKTVYVYTIIPFLIKRCFEQIRVDLCYQELPVKLIGVGGGFSYGALGVTHHALEDIALMRSLPGMTVVAPGSKFEAQELAQDIHELKTPAYVRLSNIEEKVVYPENTKINLGQAIEIIPSHSMYIIATGNSLDTGFIACIQLRALGYDIGLVSMPTIKPLDIKFLLSQKNTLKALFTIEEHNVIGGLGEAIARVLCEQFGTKIIFKAFGVQDFYFHIAGSRSYLNDLAGLSPEKITDAINTLMKANYDKKQEQNNNTVDNHLSHNLCNPGTAPHELGI